MTDHQRYTTSTSTPSRTRYWLGALLVVSCYSSYSLGLVPSTITSSTRSVTSFSLSASSSSGRARKRASLLALHQSTSSSSSSSSSFASSDRQQDNDKEDTIPAATSIIPSSTQRRRLFQHTAASFVAALATLSVAAPAHAGGLLQFPIGASTQPLKNKYHFLRAGPSELELNGIYSTNPLFLTNRENAMHESGEDIILETLETLRKGTLTSDLFPTIAYHSLAANGMDTADFVARQLQLGREKLLPEFTYLDGRGVGLWDAGECALVQPAIWALDKDEAGREGKGGRPPANTDGTPNETLGDQFIRLRQFLSLQESRTSGDIILVIFPDGTGPALMSAMIAGIPFSDVHALEFAPGEIRLDITPESVQQLFSQRKDDPAYLATLEDGREKLAQLRRTSNTKFVGLKEQMEEERRLALDEEFTQKKRADAKLELQKVERVALEKERKLQDQKQARDDKERQRQQTAAAASAASASASAAASSSSNTAAVSSASSNNVALLGGGAAALGVTGIGILAATGNDDSEKEVGGVGDSIGSKDHDGTPLVLEANVNKDGEQTTATTTAGYDSTEPPLSSSSPTTATTTTTGASGSSSSSQEERAKTSLFDNDIPPRVSAMRTPTTTTITNRVTRPTTLFDDDVESTNTSRVTPAAASAAEENRMDDDSSDRMIEEHLNELAAAEQAMKEALQEAGAATTKKAPITNDDDGADDWLNVLMEIRDEPDYDDEGEQPPPQGEDLLELMAVNAATGGGSENIQWDNDVSPTGASDSNTTFQF